MTTGKINDATPVFHRGGKCGLDCRGIIVGAVGHCPVIRNDEKILMGRLAGLVGGKDIVPGDSLTDNSGPGRGVEQSCPAGTDEQGAGPCVIDDILEWGEYATRE